MPNEKWDPDGERLPYVPGKAGNRSKYTPERVEKIVQALSIGATRSTAYRIADVSNPTFCEWMHIYPSFKAKVEEAEARAELMATARLAKEIRAPDGDWRASVEYLKRRSNREWGDRQHVDVTNLTDEQIMRLLAPNASDDAGVAGQIGEGGQAERYLASLSSGEPRPAIGAAESEGRGVEVVAQSTSRGDVERSVGDGEDLGVLPKAPRGAAGKPRRPGRPRKKIAQ